MSVFQQADPAFTLGSIVQNTS